MKSGKSTSIQIPRCCGYFVTSWIFQVLNSVVAVASCGSCTVHINGKPQRSCVTPVSAVADADITTIEAISSPQAKAVQAAWRELDVVQCGYCQSGQIMSAVGLLSENPKPSDQDIDTYMNGNACRCATYQRIRAAIHRASDMLEA